MAVAVGVLPVALTGGLYGVFYCALLTIPLALLSYVLLSQFPRLAQNGFLQVVFVVATSLIGLGWAAYTNKALNTDRTDCALLLAGFLFGAVLGAASVWLWHSPVSTRERPGGLSNGVPPVG